MFSKSYKAASDPLVPELGKNEYLVKDPNFDIRAIIVREVTSLPSMYTSHELPRLFHLGIYCPFTDEVVA
jgi:hypothetical protein